MKKLFVATTLLTATQFANANTCGGPGLPACQVPEPSMMSLTLAGVVALILVRRFAKK